jgi:pseudouridine synthase, rluA family
MPGVEIKKVKAEDDGMRLNRWFMKYYPNLTLGRLQKLLRTKQIKVDGKRAETSLKLAAGSEVRVPPMDEQPETGANRSEISRRDAEFILSLVIYKDNNIIVLNKPSGLAVQGGTNTSRHVDGMLEALRFELNEKPKLVHRIDKDTSGVLVLARNRTWADRLTKAFREHTLPKTYLALVNSCPKNLAGEIKAPLEKCGEKSLVSPDGKPAATVYKTLDEVGSKFALVETSPLTGRTHQIRAHMEYIGCPIVGDDKYFGGEKRQKYASIPDKLYLHAYKIDLSALYNKKTVIKAALPEHFKKALAALGIEFKG